MAIDLIEVTSGADLFCAEPRKPSFACGLSADD